MTLRVHITDPSGYRIEDTLENVPDLLGKPDISIWIDTTASDDPMKHFLENTLGLHALVVEDIFSDCHTPKIEDYGSFLYVVMHGVLRTAEDPENLDTHEIDMVMGSNWAFTHHSEHSRSIAAVTEELKRNPRLLSRGPATLVHAIIDHLTDYYMPLVDKFDDEIEAIETEIMERPNQSIVATLFSLKRSLQKLRRISIYQRDILQRLSRGEFELIPRRVLPFYRDVYDQFVRINDLADSYRELIAVALEVYISTTANRTNDIMKSLALISTLMLPLTFFTGVYGMNFAHIPLLQSRWGFPAAIGVMLVIATVIFIRFKTKRWL